jgi:hypothetical protein
MTDTGSNPFAEPDFSALHPSGTEDSPDEGYSDEDVDDVEDELDDEDEFDEGEEFDDAGEVPVQAVAVQENHADDAGNRVAGGTAR